MLENRDAMLARGRELIGQGLGHMWDVGMIDSMCVSEVYDQERELVQQRGHCSDRCRCQLIEHSHGYLVCPNTYQPCKAARLQRIIEMWSK